MTIPLVDLSIQHAEVADEIRRGWERVLERSAFILGDDVQRFEDVYAAFEGAHHCIGVSNGTDALELAIRALGLGAGDEIVVPANTFAATALAVVRAGATPVFCDVDPATLLVRAADVGAVRTDATKAVIPVHLYGQMAPIEEIADLGLTVIEDAAQSQGARRHGRGMASATRIAATSFYPGKNLGAYGDAGAVLTNDDHLAARVRSMRNYGSAEKYRHDDIGFNARLDTMQAVVLCAKLTRLADWNHQRREAAGRYDELLGDLGQPSTLGGNEHVHHLYVVRVRQRDHVLRSLTEAGIGAGIHYPVALHDQPAFSAYARGPLETASRAADELLSLPLFPGITAEQQEAVASAVIAATS